MERTESVTEKFDFFFNVEGNPGTEKKGEGMESVFKKKEGVNLKGN